MEDTTGPNFVMEGAGRPAPSSVKELLMKMTSLSEEEAIELLERLDEAYLSGAALVSDAEYDRLRRMAEEKWPENPYFAQVTELEGTIPHEYVIGSLRKPKIQAILKWLKARPARARYILMEKIDGMSLVVKIKNEQLVYALTRGKDGKTGTDVLQHVQKFLHPNLAGFVGEIVIRGEIVYTGPRGPGTPYDSDARAATVGLIKSGDDQYMRHMRFFAHEIINITGPMSNDIDLTNIPTTLLLLKERFALDVVPFEIETFATGVANVETILKTFIERHAHPEYEIDGCVICPERYARENVLRPLGKIAFKNPKFEGIAIVDRIEFNVGRTGRLVPVICFPTIMIGSSKVSRVTGSNFDYLAEKRIGLGAKLLIQLNVIPVIKEVLEPSIEENLIEPPKFCPVCSAPIDPHNLACVNPGCSGSTESRICHFLDKIGMKNFGASRVAALCVDSIPELYTRSINDFLKVPRFGKSMATALYNGIREKIVNIPPERFICALGVTGLGERASTKLFTQITIDELLSASTFADISDQVKLNSNIQESLGKSLRYIQDITNELRAYGLTFEQTDDEEVAVKDSNLFGKLFVISGKPEAPWKSKADVEESIIAAGGKVSSTLTKKADYLVSSAESTSAKTEKAKEWGIEILTFAQLADMLGIRSTE